jgi:hypothetical protein
MSGLFLPFSYNPESTTQTTGNYTVPSGKFARAVCQVVLGGSDIQINGTTVLDAPPATSQSDRSISVSVTTPPPGGAYNGTLLTASRPSVVTVIAE